MDTRLQEGIIGFLLFVVRKENQTANFICKWGNSLMCKTVVRSALPFFFFFFFWHGIPAIVIDKTNVYSKIPVCMSLTFIKGHKIRGKREVLKPFCCKVAWRNQVWECFWCLIRSRRWLQRRPGTDYLRICSFYFQGNHLRRVLFPEK